MGDLQVWERLVDPDHTDDRDAGERDGEQVAWDQRPATRACLTAGLLLGRSLAGARIRVAAAGGLAAPGRDAQAASPPVDGRHHCEHREQVAELQAEREAEAHLPGRHQPPGDHESAGAPAVATQEQEQGERDAAGGDHVQVPGLGDPVGGIREGGARGRPPETPQAELACKQEGAEEAERPGEQEQQVVTDECRDGARSEEAGRPVAEQRVREGEAQLVGVEDVGVEEVERLVQDRVSDPRHLPSSPHRIAEVRRDPARHVKDQRPARHDREQHTRQGRPDELCSSERG